jgi:hypothetical protein
MGTTGRGDFVQSDLHHGAYVGAVFEDVVAIDGDKAFDLEGLFAQQTASGSHDLREGSREMECIGGWASNLGRIDETVIVGHEFGTCSLYNLRVRQGGILRDWTRGIY